jgi:hypothetical protein
MFFIFNPAWRLITGIAVKIIAAHKAVVEENAIEIIFAGV